MENNQSYLSDISDPFKKYRKMQKMIDKEPDWVSWFVGFMVTVHLLSLMYLISFPDLSSSIKWASFFIWIALIPLGVSINLTLAKKNEGYPSLAFIMGVSGLQGILIYFLGQKISKSFSED